MTTRGHHGLLFIGQSGGGSYIDDYISPYGVWSATKKLIRSYNGPAIRVRRSTDNAEQNIAYSSDMLDTAALLSFIGSASGYVTKIYQQVSSLTGADLAQPTASRQPRIVNAGTMEADYVKHDGIDDYLRAQLPTGGIASAQATLFGRARIDVSSASYGFSFDLGYNYGSVPGLAIYSDERSVGPGTPGVVFAMSGGNSGPYMQRAFSDATRPAKGATHIFTCRFDLAVNATDDTSIHAYMDGSDSLLQTTYTGNPSSAFGFEYLTTGCDYPGNEGKVGLHSIVLVAADALAQRVNIEALL
jgi:hypothetical protein